MGVDRSVRAALGAPGLPESVQGAGPHTAMAGLLCEVERSAVVGGGGLRLAERGGRLAEEAQHVSLTDPVAHGAEQFEALPVEGEPRRCSSTAWWW